MMRTRVASLPSWLPFALPFAAAPFVLLPLVPAGAQSAPAKEAQPAPAPAKAGEKPSASSDRGVAYYHLALANIYEDEALENGNTDAARLAVDEYKNALNADPNSPQLNDGLADLYFPSSPMHERGI